MRRRHASYLSVMLDYCVFNLECVPYISRREILCPRWFEMRVAFTTWRDPANFDGSGRQKQSLSALASRFLATRGPYEKEACFKSFGNVELLHP